ncbi:hypothetical protein LPU83_pLPU83b_0537 (plasmid) [Rhizobium favelukesii]|uniref:Transposase n=1 Tax=Rhizobium favelukesii TaxID=348824 RepID=W6RNU0_9HYPH|nr:hypothetical protein LPU83_pLPU83b_0537 [Rhizobium favelukesii]
MRLRYSPTAVFLILTASCRPFGGTFGAVWSARCVQIAAKGVSGVNERIASYRHSPVRLTWRHGCQVEPRRVRDMAFHKKSGLTIEEMVKSRWVYCKLRNFRAGIEAGISCLKRAYGLARCTWRGLDHSGEPARRVA